jgi:hypothetical protein
MAPPRFFVVDKDPRVDIVAVPSTFLSHLEHVTDEILCLGHRTSGRHCGSIGSLGFTLGACCPTRCRVLDLDA